MPKIDYTVIIILIIRDVNTKYEILVLSAYLPIVSRLLCAILLYKDKKITPEGVGGELTPLLVYL